MGNITGVLAMPRKSLNNNFYWASELMKGHNRTVKLRLNHNKAEDGIIGSSKLIWNSETEHLEYDAIITDDTVDAEVSRMIEQGDAVKVSLGLTAGSSQEICKDDSSECMQAPIDVDFDEMSVLIGENPGIPESSLFLTEMSCGKQCVELFSETLKYNTSVRTESKDIILMTAKTEAEIDQELSDKIDKKLGDLLDNKLSTLGKQEKEPKSNKDLDSNIDKKVEAAIAKIEADKKEKLEAEKSANDLKALELSKLESAKLDIAIAELDALEKEEDKDDDKIKAAQEVVDNLKTLKLESAKKDIEESVKSEKQSITESKDLDEAKINAIVEQRVKDAISESQKNIEEKFDRKSEVTESSKTDFTEANVEEHIKLMERVLYGESITIKLDKEEIVEKFTVPTTSVFDEAVSTSGTIPGISTGHSIVIIPGGIKVKSIRPWVEVRTIKQGDTSTRFYTLTIPAFGNITEHVSTEITPATHTLTGQDLSADTPRGFRQNVLKTELEKYPAELLEKIRETARKRALEDEVTNVLSTTAASTSVDFGANHFDDVGALVTDETAEDATTALTAAALEACKQRLEEQGHEPEGGGAVAAISPRQQKELIQDTTVVRFIQQVADGTISRSGKIAMYFGLEIFVTNSLATANNSTRAIVFMKNDAFGFATARDLELEFDKNINRQSVDIVATHRVNSLIKDATAYCIVSTKAD